jgi:hypothetical protein
VSLPITDVSFVNNLINAWSQSSGPSSEVLIQCYQGGALGMFLKDFAQWSWLMYWQGASFYSLIECSFYAIFFSNMYLLGWLYLFVLRDAVFRQPPVDLSCNNWQWNTPPIEVSMMLMWTFHVCYQWLYFKGEGFSWFKAAYLLGISVFVPGIWWWSGNSNAATTFIGIGFGFLLSSLIAHGFYYFWMDLFPVFETLWLAQKAGFSHPEYEYIGCKEQEMMALEGRPSIFPPGSPEAEDQQREFRQRHSESASRERPLAVKTICGAILLVRDSEVTLRNLPKSL